MRVLAAFVSLILLLASGCQGGASQSDEELLASLPLEPHEAAGITISLPVGQVTKEVATYRNGEISVMKNEGLRVAAGLGWQLGERLSGEELVVLTDATLQNRDMTRGEPWEASLDGRGVSGVYYGGAKLSAVFGAFGCGNRWLLVSLIANGELSEMRALLERIVRSARCLDDEEAGQRPLAPVFTPPPGYGYSVTDSTAETAMFYGLDGSAFMFFLGGTGSLLKDKTRFAEAYEQVLASVLPGLELSDTFEDVVAADHGRRPMWNVRVPAQDAPAATGLLVAWHCETVKTSFVGMYVTEAGDTLAFGKRGLLSAGCPGADDDPVAGYPTAEQVFRAACEAGDLRGCAPE